MLALRRYLSYLIEGLHGAASTSNGILTANMLMNFVYNKVRPGYQVSSDAHYGQVDGGGDFILRTPNDETDQSNIAKASKRIQFKITIEYCLLRCLLILQKEKFSRLEAQLVDAEATASASLQAQDSGEQN